MVTTDKARSAIERLNAGVRALADSDAYRAYLSTMARFHHYSAGNVMLILRQRPDATQVAGYRAWQGVHRQVRTGEKGITILAPMTVKGEDDHGDPEYRVMGFRATTVFDVSQTDGDDLPELPAHPLQGAAPVYAYLALCAVARAEGVTIHDAELSPPLGGFYQRSAKSITLAVWADPAQRVKTLAHELAHHFTESDCDRPDGEIVAEGVAYVVCDALALDTSGYSFGYVLTWADGDVDRIKGQLTSVQRVAHRLLEAITPSTKGGAP